MEAGRTEVVGEIRLGRVVGDSEVVKGGMLWVCNLCSALTCEYVSSSSSGLSGGGNGCCPGS